MERLVAAVCLICTSLAGGCTGPPLTPREGKSSEAISDSVRLQVSASLVDGAEPELRFCLLSPVPASIPIEWLPWKAWHAVVLSFARTEDRRTLDVVWTTPTDWDFEARAEVPANQPVCDSIKLSSRVVGLARARADSSVLVAWAYHNPPPGFKGPPSKGNGWATGSVILPPRPIAPAPPAAAPRATGG